MSDRCSVFRIRWKSARSGSSTPWREMACKAEGSTRARRRRSPVRFSTNPASSPTSPTRRLKITPTRRSIASLTSPVTMPRQADTATFDPILDEESTVSTQARTHSADEHRADLDFYFDPVCPFAWMTSKWVRMVAEQRAYAVDWRFISLRMINAHIDYDAHFPAGYEDGHTAGLRLLRVATRARIDYGREAVGPLYLAIGRRIFDSAPDGRPDSLTDQGSRGFLEPILLAAGLPDQLV